MLTPKQEKFCCVYIQCSNASEAYRQSYDASKMLTTSVHRKAKELLDNVKITARIKELQQPMVQEAQVTLSQHLKDLKELRDLAKTSEKYDAAVKAEIARGKASGLHLDRVKLEGGVTLNLDFNG